MMMMMMAKWFLLALVSMSSSVSEASAGSGTDCAACTVVIGIIERLTIVHNSTVDKEVEKFCELFPKGPARTACDVIIADAGPTIIALLTAKETPDVVCHALKLCTAECSLYPKKTPSVIQAASRWINAGYTADLGRGRSTDLPKICDLPELKKICEIIYGFANNHDPLEDEDGDGFSAVTKTLRGTYWRGKDCNGHDPSIHPGRKPINEDRDFDSNCNGISGVNPQTNVPYETELCGDVMSVGTLVLGDSASAHFHIPPQFLDGDLINNHTYENILEIIENEFDWPMLSASTAYFTDTSAFPEISGPVNSSYMITRNRNRCAHRDFQNLGVNGARVGAMNSTIQEGLSRNQSTDNPLLVMYALIGNDVCNGHPDTLSHMTPPDVYRANVISTMEYLNKRLPNGSNVLMMGLADGRVLWDGLHSRSHPISPSVTYEDLYNYLNCLEISPCRGWMNNNETLRNETTAHAMNLSAVLADVAATQTFANFKMHYFDNPLKTIIPEYLNSGGQIWELIEPVDGFHPNQKANAMIADAVWDMMAKEVPDFLPPINPNNAQIEKLFGNQGGY